MDLRFNATFNNISVILWWLVLLVEETGEPEKTTDLPQFTDKFDHIMEIYLHEHGNSYMCDKDQ